MQQMTQGGLAQGKLHVARQKGAATLFVTITIMALLLVIAAVSAKIGMFELKTAANINRSKEALHAAQGAVDRAVAFKYEDDAYSGESGLSIGNMTASVSVTGSADDDIALFTGYGKSEDGTGNAVVSEKYSTLTVIEAGIIPPLMGNGGFAPTGSYSIVAHPNGGGTGVPVSAWVESTSFSTGTWQTCGWDEYLHGDGNFGEDKDWETDEGVVYCPTCSCSNLTSANDLLCARDSGEAVGDCVDIVVQDPMTDPFQQLFGVSAADGSWVQIRDYAQEFQEAQPDPIETCEDLKARAGDAGAEFGTGKPRIYWIEDSSCNLNSGPIGSVEHPIIVVVQDGDSGPGNTATLNLGGGFEFWGVLFAFSDIYTDSSNPEEYEVNANGGATIYGSLMVNAQTDTGLPNGGFNLIFHESILSNLTGGGDGYDFLVRLRGSWRDFE